MAIKLATLKAAKSAAEALQIVKDEVHSVTGYWPVHKGQILTIDGTDFTAEQIYGSVCRKFDIPVEKGDVWGALIGAKLATPKVNRAKATGKPCGVSLILYGNGFSSAQDGPKF